jgi:hypothetical protein
LSTSATSFRATGSAGARPSRVISPLGFDDGVDAMMFLQCRIDGQLVTRICVTVCSRDDTPRDKSGAWCLSLGSNEALCHMAGISAVPPAV